MAGTINNLVSNGNTGTVTISSNIGPNVTAITETSITSGLTMSGTLTVNPAGTTINVPAGTQAAAPVSFNDNVNGTGNFIFDWNRGGGISLPGTFSNTGSLIISGGGTVNFTGAVSNIGPIINSEAALNFTNVVSNTGAIINTTGIITFTTTVNTIGAVTNSGHAQFQRRSARASPA